MVVITINKVDYRVYEKWNEVSVAKARDVYSVAKEIPDVLDSIYKEYSKGEDADKDQLRIFKEELGDCHDFKISCLCILSDVPKEIAKQINKDDLNDCYDNLLFGFIFGVLYYPINKMELITEFTKFKKTYYAPYSEEIMGTDRPFANEVAAVFCDASDLDSDARKGNKYQHAEHITSIIFREKGKPYDEKEAMNIAFNHKGLINCDVYHSALMHLSNVNTTLKLLSPNLYQKGDVKGSIAAKQSGLSDFGWMNSIMTVAEMGVLNQKDLTPFQSVQQTNLYEFMTVLSNLRATSDYQRIYAEKQKK